MLQPWDIYRWNQHSLIKDLTNPDPDLRTRIFWWWGGGGIPPNLPLAPRYYHVLTQCYHKGHGGLLTSGTLDESVEPPSPLFLVKNHSPSHWAGEVALWQSKWY